MSDLELGLAIIGLGFVGLAIVLLLIWLDQRRMNRGEYDVE